MNQNENTKTKSKGTRKEPTRKLEGSEIVSLASFFEILIRIDQRQKRNGKNN
jgi:hypothetical protein